MSSASTSSPGRQTWILWRCEMRQLLRDRRALFAGVLLPALLYPLLFWSQGKLESVAEEIMADHELTLILALEDVDAGLSAELRAGLEASGEVTLEDLATDLDASSLWGEEEPEGLAGDPREDPLTLARLELLGEAHALLAGRRSPIKADRHEFRIFYNIRSDESREARGRGRAVVRELAAQWRRDRLDALPGGDPGAHLSFESVDVASAQDKSGAGLGRMLPLFSLLMILTGGAFAALGAFAGEREGKTLETLLVQPVPARVVALGKYGAVLCAGLATLLINLISLGICASRGLVEMPGLSEGSAGLPPSRLLAGLLFLPACTLVAALLSLFCGRARTYREGQFTLFPVMLISIVPSLVVMRPDLEASLLLCVVPFAGPALILRDGLAGQFAILPTLLMFASHGLWTWLVLERLKNLLDSERTLSSTDLTAEAGQRGLSAGHGKTWAFVGVLGLYLIGSRLQQWNLAWGLALTLWGLLPVLTALAIKTRPAPTRPVAIKRFLSLSLPSGAHALGAVLLIPALAKLMVEVYLPFQSRILPLPQSVLENETLGLALTHLSTPMLIFLLAISPAICEELFFRGAILGSLRRGLTPVRALLWQALFFGAAHASLYRILPTAGLGLLLGALTLRSASLLPAVLVHAGYNTVVVLAGMERLSTDGTWLSTWGPWLALPGLALLALGARKRD